MYSKIKRYVTLVLFIIVAISCTKETWLNNDGTELTKMAHTSLDSIKFAVVECGDTTAFKKLVSLYEEKNNFNFYPYALIMSKWYGYYKADYYVYRSLMDRDTLDEHLRDIAVEYLQRAIENGDTAAMSEMNKSQKRKKVD